MSRNLKTGYPSKDKTHLQGFSRKLLKPTILPISIFGAFMMINSKRLHEPSIQQGDRIYSKKEVRSDALTLIKAFRTYSIGRGKRLAIITPNFYEGIVMTMAANAVGVQVVYFNPLETDEELLKEIDEYAPDVLFVYDRNEEFVKMVDDTTFHQIELVINFESGKCGSPAYYQTSYSSRIANSDLHDALPIDFISYEIFWLAGDADEKSATPTILRNLFSKKVSLFLQTSGSSSGKPKGLPFTNEAIFASMIYAVNSSGTKTNDERLNKVMCILPYRLPYGWALMFMNLMGGNCVVLAPGATPEDIGNYYKYEPSYIYGTPVILRAFIDNTPEDVDLGFLRAFFAAGFSTSEGLYEETMDFFAKHGATLAELRNNYGIGEALCVGTVSDGLPHFENTVGKFWLGPEWYLVDDDLNEVKYGEIGEALLFSKTLCKGYVNQPELTKETFIKYRGKTFYRSGDYMSLDENGIVTFYGRRKRFYQPLGATDKVNCETLEKVIVDCPIVRECAVVVVPDKEKVTTSKAFVVLNDDYFDVTGVEARIREYISDKLLDYQMPGYFAFLNEIPLMKSGKINYSQLEKM